MILTQETITIVAIGISVAGFIYATLRNFKADIKSNIKIDFDHLERRIDRFEMRMNEMDTRIFFLATRRSLDEAILEEKMKKWKQIDGEK